MPSPSSDRRHIALALACTPDTAAIVARRLREERALNARDRAHPFHPAAEDPFLDLTMEDYPDVHC